MLRDVVGVSGWPVAFRGRPRSRPAWSRRTNCADRATAGCSRTRADDCPDLALRSRACYRYVEGRGVLAGYSAAELLGASCGPGGAPVEVLLLLGKQRDHPGLVVHRDRIAPGEIVEVDGVRLTS